MTIRTQIISEQTGFTLVEVMIAMVIFGIGLLGLAGLQATSLMNEHSSYTRSQAVLLAYEMADRMRANPDGGTDYETTTGEATIPGYTSTLCTGAACTPANMAIFDLGNWKEALPDLLPSGQGQIVNTAGTSYTITVHWDEDRTGATGTNMHTTPQIKSFPRGLSLIELIIAIAVSSILMLGIAQVFSLNKRAYNTQDDAARMQESGRFAFNLLMQDLRRAGYYGGNANIDNITGSSGLVAPTNTCPNDATWARMIQRPIIGLDDTNTGYTGCIPNADYTRGDILVTRYTRGIPATTFDTNRLYVRSSMFEGRLFLGSAEANADNQVSEVPNAAFELEANAYYVGPSTRNCRFNDSAGNPIPIPALWREVLNDAAVPVAEEVANGIEHLQFQYGIDTDDDNAVNRYYNADEISNDITTNPNWTQVIAVRLWILARADCPTNDYTNTNTYTMGDITYDPDPDDSFKRQLYSTTVAIRN